MKKYIVLFVLFLQLACLPEGTETGNPMTENLAVSFSGKDLTITGKLIYSICSQIFNCHSNSDVKECYEDLVVLGGLPKAFDTESNFIQMAAYANMELEKKIQPSSENMEFCKIEIEGIDCSDPRMAKAYSGTSVSEYKGVPDLIPKGLSACQQIY